ncbi:Flp pilus assembly protein TadG [Actinomyces bovis]|uniref:Flp pilus assembly protein TadG n=1 Tax=Actinomyces bovis TaxID=1658 RepID=A0ABY1VNE4_9ACTO|nr:pilus assembly protein TadG-related protein [Actinomyces bovis]SPT53629.1 Flp pilus assembly protein TadG [Actinomyces bovis]VEG55688.1 Flp pilus assembly protein TadG [Actinomyces israelii]
MRIRRPLHLEEGSSSVFAICVVSVMMLLVGLCIDGGRVLNARASLADAAEQAARAGAQKVQADTLRSTDALALDAPAAASAARSYMSSSDAGKGSVVTVSTTGSQVTVSARNQVSTGLLALVGMSTINIEVSARAKAVGGVSKGEF